MLENIENFRKTYPNVTSADLQTFVLGMQSRENEVQSLLFIIKDVLEILEGDRKKWIEEKLEEHQDIYQPIDK